ncbi:MAG: peptide-methionine (S)-S-oxide reductase MsrA, partial [Mesorhizobium sp.]
MTNTNNRSAGLVRGALAALALAVAGAAFWLTPAISAEDAVKIPPPAIDEKAAPGSEKAIFAGGCFWGVQGVFQHVKGVSKAVSGYTGGAKDDAVYETVGTGRTGHAESVEITYDPSVVTYGQLLQVYFSVAHNPTQLNYQGPDSGTQY